MRDKHKTLFVISGLIIIVLAVYWQVRNFEFVNCDDDKYVSRNNHISSGLTVNNITWVFTHAHVSNWHPLTGLSHILDCELFGLNPGRHHLVNLLFHIVNTILIFIILRRMTGAFWQSAFVAAVFGLHPLHVESVAWISERKDVLSTVFWFLTIGAYFRYAKNPSVSRYVLTLVLFVLGLMSKPILVTLPFVLLLLDYWPLNRFESKVQFYDLVREKIPFFIFSAVSSFVTFFVQKNTGAMVGIQEFPLANRITNAVMSYVGYIGKMIWPVNLAVFYPYPENMPPAWQVFAAAVLLLAITIAVIRLGGKYRYLPVGWFWYLGTLVPVIGIVQVGLQSMADRYTYIPLTGLFIIVAWGANDLLAGWKYRKIALGLSSAAIILVLSVCAWFQAGYWRDSISLFTHALETTSGNCLAHNDRGVAYNDKGEFDHAIADFNKALEINPRYAEAYYNRGNTYARGKGMYDLAVADYSKAIEINPGYAKAYSNRGTTYYYKGEYDLAVSAQSRALEIDPRYAEAYCNRGIVYYLKGELDRAIADYNRALEINPGYIDAYFNKALACEAAGRKAEAVEAYKTFIRYASGQPKYTPYIEQIQQKIKQLEQ